MAKKGFTYLMYKKAQKRVLKQINSLMLYKIIFHSMYNKITLKHYKSKASILLKDN